MRIYLRPITLENRSIFVLEKEAINLSGDYVDVLCMTILVKNYKKGGKA